jgi:hypothetical protein
MELHRTLLRSRLWRQWRDDPYWEGQGCSGGCRYSSPRSVPEVSDREERPQFEISPGLSSPAPAVDLPDAPSDSNRWRSVNCLAPPRYPAQKWRPAITEET